MVNNNILYQKRIQMKMTQKQVADLASITVRQYQRFEQGERSLASASLRIGLAICDVLRLDPHTLCMDASKQQSEV